MKTPQAQIENRTDRRFVRRARSADRSPGQFRNRSTSKLFDPGFGFEHGGLHAPLDFETARFDGVAVGVGGNGDGFRERRKRPG